MARITSNQAVEQVGNRFQLVLIAAQRTRELTRGSLPKVESKNSNQITALREIEAGKIDSVEYIKRHQQAYQKRVKRHAFDS